MKYEDEDTDQGVNLNAGPNSDSLVNCTICLEIVDTDGARSKAKLQCGHEFHLDCIGSAFNVKGIMQCPNCRNVEKGQWLYTNGSTNLDSGFSMNSWMAEQYPFFLVPYGFRICPFRGFMEMDDLSIAGQAIYGNYDNFTQQMPPSSSGLAYFTYFRPPPHVSLNPDDHRNGSHMIETIHQSTLNSRATSGGFDVAMGSRFSGHPFSSSQRPGSFTPIVADQNPNNGVYSFGGVHAPYPFNPHLPQVATPLPFPPGFMRSNGFPAYDPRATAYQFPVQQFAGDSDQYVRH